MSDLLTRLLSTRDWLMADGATGTNLFNMGLSSGDAPEMWNIDHPDRIHALYRSAVDAGSDIFLTNSFGGNASRLKLHGAEGRVRELNRVAASIGRDVADAAGRPVVVAGSMGPTGDIFEPMGTMTHAVAVEMFHEQAEGLKEGGVDVLWVETISAPEEYKAAAEAARLAGMPWCGTMSFRHRRAHHDGRHFGRDGRDGRQAAQSADRLWRELRRGRLRSAAHRAGLCRARAGMAHHREGQRGHPEVSGRPHPLRRHAPN